MLDIKYLRQNIELVSQKMKERGQPIDFDRFLDLDTKRRDILLAVETLRNERNDASKKIGELKKKKTDASTLIARMSEVSAKIKELDENLKITEEELNNFVMMIPNIQHESVPIGQGSEDNPSCAVGEKSRLLAFEPKAHWDIGESLNILDFARGAKIAGARFTLYRGLAAAVGAGIDQFHARLTYRRAWLYRSADTIHG